MIRNDMLPAINKVGYSKLQFFFWLISGCEISILKSCKSDYNRQAGIGFTIFMTSLFAACSGGYAGYYFTESIWAAFAFGVIWSMLVFSIDRMLVVTLKKDPTREKQAVLMPLLGRMVLALLIAFVISIPIELLVFRDQIEIQKRVDKQNGIGSYQTQIMNNSRLADKKQSYLADSARAAQALSDSKDLTTDPDYVEIRNRRDAAQKEYDKANVRYLELQHEAANRGKYNDNNYLKNLLIKSQAYQNARERFLTAKRVLRDLNDSLDRERVRYRTEKSNDYQTNTKRGEGVQNELDTIDTKVKIAGKEMDSLYHKSFIRDFISLENAAYAQQTTKGKVLVTTYVNESLLFFLWLIRILFFTLEILPTVAKIATPLGAYDRAICAYEQDMKADLEARSIEHSAQQAKIRQVADEEELRQEKSRAKMEGKLHDDLLKELSAAQYEIGKQKIEAFRKANIPDTRDIPVT